MGDLAPWILKEKEKIKNIDKYLRCNNTWKYMLLLEKEIKTHDQTIQVGIKILYTVFYMFLNNRIVLFIHWQLHACKELYKPQLTLTLPPGTPSCRLHPTHSQHITLTPSFLSVVNDPLSPFSVACWNVQSFHWLGLLQVIITAVEFTV